MGWMSCFGNCIGCGQIFEFNPNLVPALPANISPTGEKEPICKACVARVNPQRIANGLEPIVPLPGAYEPVEVP